MQRAGFELAGLEMRVMGVEELLDELRSELQSLEQRYRMDEATDDLRRRLDEILDREQRAQREQHGYESQRMNEFLERRNRRRRRRSPTRSSASATGTSPTPRPGRSSASCSRNSSALRKLEAFLARARRALPRRRKPPTTRRRSRSASASRRWSSSRAISPVATSRRSTPNELRELLSENALRSLVLLRDLRASLERAGYLRGGDDARAHAARDPPDRRAGARRPSTARCARVGRAATTRCARASRIPRPDETRPWQFGDAFDVDVVQSPAQRGATTRNAHGAAPIACDPSRSRTSRSARWTTRPSAPPCCCST